MKRKFYGFLILFLVSAVQVSFAQQVREKTVTGKVVDDSGIPLGGVNVTIKGTTMGAQTDFDGDYRISVDLSDVLVFSFVGFKRQEIPVGSRSVINVSLEVDADALEEVIVVGYRSSTKEKSSIASTTITAESIENRPNASFIQTLSGQVAGLNITTSTGQPGGNSLVNIRGVNSINGDTEPLFIIDGAPVDADNFRSLNPQDIASVSVLKDAGATAIYGNRGANGVIIIETRRGSFNSPLKINASTILGFSELQDNEYDLNSSPEELRLEKQQNTGRGATLTDGEIASTRTFDWKDFFFRTATSTQHNVSLASGSSKATQYTSLGFSDIEGILVDSDLKRFNIRNNVSGRSEDDRFNYTSNLSINYSENNEPSNIGSGAINRNFILGAFQSLPYIFPEDYTNGRDLVSPLSFANTPLFLVDRLFTFFREEEELKLIGSFNASFKITDHLTARAVLGTDYQNQIRTTAEGPESFNAILFAEEGNDTPGSQTQSTQRVFTFNQVTSLNYNNTWGDHTLDAGAYIEYFKAHLRSFGYTANGLNSKTFFPGDDAGFIDDNSSNDFFTDEGFATIRDAGLFSYFGNIDYDYGTKYGFGFTIRRDASYRFTEDNAWGTFGSVSARWNIHNEDFMAGSIFDVLKIRGSYGEAGNQNIGGGSLFSAPDLFRSTFTTGTGYAGFNALFPGQLGNPTLQWETVKSANLGIDFEIFTRRLRGSIDGYIKETQDLFQDTPVSAINGVTQLDANTGSLWNRGVDMQLKYDVLRGGAKGVNLRLDFTGGFNETELDDLPSEEGEIIGIGRNGGKLFEYFVLRYAGVNPANGNLLFLTADGDVTENPNADTDRVWLDKNIIPDYQGSFGFNLDYRGFFVTTQWNYVIGVDRFDFDLAGFQNPDNIGQFRHSRDLNRAWTPDNRVTDIPALGAANRNDFFSTRFLRESDYLRLRFASLGYAFPRETLDLFGLASFRVFANGENLVTFSEWRGFDAESSVNTSRRYPTPRTIQVGVEIGL